MIVKLLTEHHLEFLSLNRGYRGSSESTHVKMPHCWKSHAMSQILQYCYRNRVGEFVGERDGVCLLQRDCNVCTTVYLPISPQHRLASALGVL